MADDHEALESTLVDVLVKRVTDGILRNLLPRLETAVSVKPRWLSIESAGVYIDKTYHGMRYTINRYSNELPIAMIGDQPRIDIQDIDRFMLKRKR